MNESEFVDDLHPKIWRACLLMETHQSEAPALFGILSDLDRHWGVDTKLTHLLMCGHWDQDPRPEAIWFEVKRYPGEAELWGLVAARSAPPIGYYWPQQHRWAAWWARRGIHTREHTHTDTHTRTHTHTHTQTPTNTQTHTFVRRREQMEIEAMTLTMEVGVHRLIVPVIIKEVIELILHEWVGVIGEDENQTLQLIFEAGTTLSVSRSVKIY